MRVSTDSTTLLNTSDTLLQNNKTAQTQSSVKIKASTDTTGAETTAQTPRETYGLTTIENMTDEEYAAFQRSTAGMSQSEKIRSAQSLHMVAKSYEQAQTMLNGSGMLAAMNGDGNGFFKSDASILDNGIKVLSQMTNGEGHAMAGFLARYRGALSTTGLNLSA